MVEGLIKPHCLFGCYLGDLFVDANPGKIVDKAWITASLQNIYKGGEPEAARGGGGEWQISQRGKWEMWPACAYLDIYACTNPLYLVDEACAP